MYQTIPIQYLDRYLEQGFNGRIIDLRNVSSYQYSHIDGADNIPFDELMRQPSMLTAKTPILFYCARGSESMLACNYFFQRGYSVVNVANGLNLYAGKYLVRG
ncbi:MAG: rhodanese-like domain-containing protein [Clostridium sp.]